MRTRAFRCVFWASPLLALAGCPRPVQYGGPIPIDGAGLHERIRGLCRLGLAEHAGGTCAGTSEADR